MARMTNAQLREEIDRLASQNNALLAEVDQIRAAVQTPPISAAAPPVAVPRRRSRWWSVFSVFLIIVGLVLAPAALVSNWAANELTDTDRFVATFAPLADDPAVQSFVAAQVLAVVHQNLDITGITDRVFDGIDGLGLPPRSSSALQLLRRPAVAGLNSLVEDTVDRFVRSDAFSTVFAQSLRTTHAQLNATVAGDSGAIVSVGGNGEIGIELAPIIERVKEALVARGLTFAESIPTVNRTIVIAQAQRATMIQAAYGLGVGAGAWLPWVSLFFLIIGVLVARRRLRTLLGASISLAAVLILLGSGLRIGRVIFTTSLSPAVMPADAAGAIYDRVVRYVDATTLAITVLAVTIAIVVWLASPFRAPIWLRTTFSGAAAALRGVGERRGLSTGGFGAWLYRQRLLVRVGIGVIAAAVILFVRPLTPDLIVWTAVIALVLVGIGELIARPIVDSPREPDQNTPIVVEGVRADGD